MRRYILLCISILLFATATAGAQDSAYTARVKKYIEQYYPLAIAEQKSDGIPASITLGQGILETDAGNSELMTMANNHFGIKCRNGWEGETFLHDDDAPQECFKKYPTAADSYKDHTRHLKRNPRYSPLFDLPQSDYAAWAQCLKKCGYATNPQYATKLIQIIENFELQQYTTAAIDTNKLMASAGSYKPALNAPHLPLPAADNADAGKVKLPAPAPVNTRQQAMAAPIAPPTAPAHHLIQVNALPDSTKIARNVQAIDDSRYDSGKVIVINGLKAFYAYKGDMLLQYAVKYKMRYQRLLEINDLPDAPLANDMLIYLEKKLPTGTHAKHTVKEGETMFSISQAEGMQLKRLMALNLLEGNEEPITGTVLELGAEATQKPKVRTAVAPVPRRAVIADNTTKKNKPDNDYIPTVRPKIKDTVVKESTAQVNKISPDDMAANTAPPAVVAKEAQAAQETAQQPVAVKDPAPAEEPAAKEEPLKAEPAAVTPAPKEPVPTPAADTAKADSLDAELLSLKAEMDKVVYADDSKLGTKAAVAATPEKKALAAHAKPEANNSKYYTVKKGETAGGIANRHNITLKQLIKWNKIDPDDLSEGQKLRVKE